MNVINSLNGTFCYISIHCDFEIRFISIRENYQLISRNRKFKRPLKVPYEVAFTMLLHLLSNLFHSLLTLH